jgi:putative transposase
MRTSEFSPEQVLKALRQAGCGTPVRQICIDLEISEATFYRWRKLYSGQSATEISRARELEQENARLRRSLYIQRLEISILREKLAASVGKPAAAVS